jgi:hypothetical protein
MDWRRFPYRNKDYIRSNIIYLRDQFIEQLD